MANGMEQDIRDIRKEVGVIQRDGCGQRKSQDEAISGLWREVDTINAGRSEFMRNILVSVLGMVLLLLFGNFIVTKSTISEAMKANDASASAIATENQRLLRQLATDIKAGKR